MKFKYKLLPFLVTTAIAGISTPIAAAPIQSATANWTINGVAGAGDSQTSSIPGYVDILQNHSGIGGEVFYHTYGSVSAGSVFFGSRSSGSGKYDLTSPYKLDDYEFRVGGTGTVAVYFNFVIDNGELGIYCGTCSGGGLAELKIDIAVNNSSVASGAAKLETTDNAGSTRLTHSGIASQLFSAANNTTDSIGNTGGISYGWGQTMVTQFLGNYQAGTDLLIDYELTTRAMGNFDAQESGYAQSWLCDPNNVEFAAFAVGEIVQEQPNIFAGCNQHEIFNYLGNSIARAGDPFGNIPTGQGIITRDANVPEPGSLALLGAGLLAAGGLAGSRRRKRKPAA